MSFKLGVFDVFANVVPGALAIFLGTYVSWRFGALTSLDAEPLMLILVAAILSHTFGLILYPLGRRFSRLTRNYSLIETARSNVNYQWPGVADSPLLHMDINPILSALRLAQPEAHGSIATHQAHAIMLRSSSVPLAGGALVAAAELGASSHRLATGLALCGLSVLTVVALQEAHRRSIWAFETAIRFALCEPSVSERLRIQALNHPFTP